MPTPRSPDHSELGESDADRMTDALVAMHERLVYAAHLDRGSRDEPAADSDDSLAANELLVEPALDELADCLERLERTRRFALAETPANVFHFRIGASGREASEFGDATARHLNGGAARIGRFEILSELGRGGLGVVLLAYDPVLKRQIALKIPNPEGIVSPSLRRRFQREGHAAARLQHPHIVPVYEVGEIGPICFIAAAYIDGPNLAQWMAERRGACDSELAARLIADLADAMHYAHEQGILHRDLKPSNILLERPVAPRDISVATSDRQALSAKITDFGLAKFIDQQEDETRHGAVLGTPSYMAPEQARGETAAIGRSSDVYSLGAILYELLSGQTPYTGDSDSAVLARLLGPDEPLPLRRSQPQVSRDLEAICHRCLEKEPRARYATAGELAADLRRFLAGEPTQARPLSAGQRLARWSRRKPALAALVAVSVLAVVVLAAGGEFYTRQLKRAVVSSVESARAAQWHRSEAVMHEARAKEQLYAARMQLADIALHEGDVRRAEEFLDKYQVDQPDAKLRGVEWHLLKAEVNRMWNQGSDSSTLNLPHACPVFTATFMPDMSYSATGGEDGQIRIWNHLDCKSVFSVAAHSSCINQIRIARDGTQMATASCDCTAKVWRLESSTGPPQLLRAFSHTQPVRCIAWSPDGRRLATLSAENNVTGDGTLSIWTVADGELIDRRLAGVRGLAWSPSGDYLAINGTNGIQVLRTSDWEIHFERAAYISSIAFHPDGRLSYFEHPTGIWIHDLTTNDRQLVRQMSGVGLIGWGGRPAVLARSANSDIQLLDTSQANRSTNFVLSKIERISDMAVSHDSQFLITAGFENICCVTALATRWHARPTLRQPWGQPHRFEVTGIDDDGRAVTVRRVDSEQVGRLDLDWEQRREVNWNEQNDGRQWGETAECRLRAVPGAYAATATGGRQLQRAADGTLQVLDFDSKLIRKLPIRIAETILSLDILPASNLGVVQGFEKIHVIDLTRGAVLREIPCDNQDGKPLMVDAPSDGRWVALAGNTGVRTVDLNTGESRDLLDADYAGDRFTKLVVSPNGRLLALGAGYYTVQIRDAKNAVLYQRVAPNGHPHAWEFSADNRCLAVATDLGLELWHIHADVRMASLAIPGGVRVVRFSPDDRTLYGITGNQEAVEVYRWTSEDAK